MSRPSIARPQIYKAGAGGYFGYSPAKINLYLNITGKRADGYHEVETLLVTVDLYDTLEVQLNPDDRISLDCWPNTIPADETNLVWRAAASLRNATGTTAGAAFRLTKRIPHEAGLGGGSSDAALTLVLLNQLWRLGLSLPELRTVAATVGSDVGFFLTPGAAWCTGRGELVEPVSLSYNLTLILLKPPFGLSTKAVYANFSLDRQAQTTAEAMKRCVDVATAAQALHNSLEIPAFQTEPRLHSYANLLRSFQPLGVMLSGSGSCLFAIVPSRAQAESIAAALRQQVPECQVFILRAPAPLELSSQTDSVSFQSRLDGSTQGVRR